MKGWANGNDDKELAQHQELAEQSFLHRLIPSQIKESDGAVPPFLQQAIGSGERA